MLPHSGSLPLPLMDVGTKVFWLSEDGLDKHHRCQPSSKPFVAFSKTVKSSLASEGSHWAGTGVL